MDRNRFGLSRRIPASIKRTVRKRDGYGCVVCGDALIEYEHFNPEFSHAKKHDVNGIILLCKKHHDQKGTVLSRSKIAEHARSPRCRQDGFSFGAFDSGDRILDVKIGNVQLRNTRTVIRAFGDTILGFDRAETPGGPIRINAIFFDRNGASRLRIQDNEWQIDSGTWDVKVVRLKSKNCDSTYDDGGVRIIVFHGPNEIALQLRLIPDKGVIIEKIHMFYKGWEISGDEHRPTTFRFGHGGFQSHECEIDGADVGFSFDEKGISVGIGGSMRINSAIIGNFRESSFVSRRAEPYRVSFMFDYKSASGETFNSNNTPAPAHDLKNYNTTLHYTLIK